MFAVNDALYVKTGDGLYKLEGKKWELQEMQFQKTYVFFEKGFFEADYLPNKYLYIADPVSYLIPQRSITNASKADLGEKLFISAGGALFEYVVNNNYRHYYEGASIRDIYLENGFKVISSYSGIYINDSLRSGEPRYSNGYMRKIRNRYFLSADHLYEVIPPAQFREIPAAVNVFAGYSRKLLEYRGHLYSLNTKSLNRLDSSFNLEPIHQGYEYQDMEVVGNKILFCTQTGEVFQYDGKAIQQLLKLSTRIRDIYQFKNTIYLSSDGGVYTFENLDPGTLRLFSQTPFSVMVLIDALRNTWISTENGLYLQPDQKKDLIPYIEGVEFNRGALTLFNDTVYAGSMSGLYVIDCYHVVRNFLPVYFNKVKADKTERGKKWGIYGTGIIVLLGGLGVAYQAYRRRRAKLIIPQKEVAPALTIDHIANAIRSHNIMTVEGLAEFYKTNTVQLNRQFKTFDTTPGKFMKTVKINYARELLKNKVPMEEVVSKVGYTAGFIKKELKGKGSV